MSPAEKIDAMERLLGQGLLATFIWRQVTRYPSQGRTAILRQRNKTCPRI
jgi:hypothetical protein